MRLFRSVFLLDLPLKLSYCRYSCICIVVLLMSACKPSSTTITRLTPVPGFSITMIPEDAEQILVVSRDATDAIYQGYLIAYEKKNGKNVMVFDTIKASLGRSGIVAPALKKEGDGATPAGFYQLGQLFTYESNIDTRLTFIQVTPEDKWVDDAASPDYNKYVRGATQAKSFENLLLASIDYKYCMVIEYNTQPVVKGKGSAIFFHITSNQYPPTAGCVAIQEPDMLRILSWLQPNKKKYIVIIAR